MQRETIEFGELLPERLDHIRSHFPDAFSDAFSGVDLPYGLLRGEGMERLCALLLIADGQAPRYFGPNGSTDYGVDIVVSDGATCIVYQCKNVAIYRKGDLSRWLQKFALEWLAERPNLPKPDKYVLVCPLDLRQKDDIESVKKAFYDQHGVAIDIWTKTLLDQRLKRLPDIVTDLFSAKTADVFCSLSHHWDDGFTAPLAPAGRGARAVNRFLSLRDEGMFAPGGDELQERLDLLRDEGLVAFVGASGSGKSMAALDLASAMAESGWRPWHVDMRSADPSRVYESMERRATRPSVFVLDDCQLALEATHRVVRRFRTAKLDGRARLILTVTTTATSDPAALDQGEISAFIRETVELQEQIVVRPGADMYRRILRTTLPDLAGPPSETVERLQAVTAGDLFLLAEALRVTEGSASEQASALETVTVDMLQSRVMERYFGELHPSAPTIRLIAAVAQFDAPVPKKGLKAPTDRLRDRMLVSTGPPPGWLFTHAALGELIYSALSIAEADADPDQFAVDAIVTHGLAEMPSDRWAEGLTKILRARLKLVDDRPFKRLLLHDERVRRRLQAPTQKVPLATLSLACFLTIDGDAPSPYLDLLAGRIERVLAGATGIPSRDLQLFGIALRTFGLADPERFGAVLDSARPEPVLRTFGVRAGLPDAMDMLQNVSPGFADRLIEALDPDTLDALVQRTIDGGRSVGTISWALRELGDRDDDQRQLVAFEAKLGPHRMARLIHERADLSAAMRIIQRVTPGFADRLIEALEPDALDALVQRTIDGGRSVGTINLALRELGDRDDDQRQLVAFEAKLGPHRMARLIHERADLPAAMRIIQRVTPGFADRLIEALEPETFDALVQRTIDGGRSVGTINLALRELGGRDNDQRQLVAFEAKLGPHRMARLIHERADLPAAMMILRDVTPGFADRLIKAFEPDTLDALVHRTIDGGIKPRAPNIRNLPKSRRLFVVLENHLRPETWWRLISGCGDLEDLASLLLAFGSTARTALLSTLDEGNSADWVAVLARTNAFGLSTFIQGVEAHLGRAARAIFEDTVVAGMHHVVTRSTWSELGVAHGRLAFGTESPVGAAFLEHLRAKAEAVDLDSPPALEDLVLASNLCQVLWKERPQDRRAVANAIFTILPEGHRWPLDYRRLIAARLLLGLAQSEEVPQPVAERLFDAFSHFSTDIDIATCDAKTLFLYFFNIWAVIIARTPNDHGALVASQDMGFWARLLDHIDTLALERANHRKLGLLSLVGLLEFTSVFPKKELDRHVRGVVRGFPILLNASEGERAVMRFFAFRGLAMIGPRRLVEDRTRIGRLLDDLRAYPDQTPVFRHMQGHLSL